MSELHAVTVPKWGLSMEEGVVLSWHKQVGDAVATGEELVDIETSKITNAVEASVSGILHRILAASGATLPCGAIIAVIGPPGASEAAIDALLAEQQALVAEGTDAQGAVDRARPQLLEVRVAGAPHRLRYIDTGGAAAAGSVTVLLLHGYGGDLDNWMFTWPALAQRHRVIAVDLPGHGFSQKEVGDGAAATLALQVGALLDAIAPANIHVIAHSFGAMVARELMAQRPAMIRSLAAIAPADLAPVCPTYLAGFLNARRRSEMSATLGLLFATPELAGKDMAENMLRYKRLDGVDSALRAISAANFMAPRPEPGAVALWQELGVRGTLIWGSDDAIVSHLGMDSVGVAVQRHLVNGAGHMPHIEKADAVNRLLLEHLSRCV